MGRKWFDKVLFVLVIVACIVFTWFVGRGALDMMLYNFAFLVLMVIICIVGMVLGFGKMAKLERAFDNAAEEIDNTFNVVDSIESSPASLPEDLFENEELDERYHEFTGFIRKSQSGIGDIEDYINEDEVDSIFGRRLVELIPDVLTSLGILGTFIGLVFGLKNFEPSDYEAMTASVTSLVNGIKVAFLTSIYGLSLSLVFGYGTKAAYSDLMNKPAALPR